MSNRRQNDNLAYRGYLRSPAWRERRTLWFGVERRRTGRAPECKACLARRFLELHHLDYRGVEFRPGTGWLAAEPHTDLVALCRRCHEAVHLILDHEPGSLGQSRRPATLAAIQRIQARILSRVMGDSEKGQLTHA